MTAEPESLGPYRIVRRIGAGGMGVVYEAVHTGLGKRVALKVLPRELAEGRLDRFLREARTAAGLHHTNIVPVFDVGQVDGVPYYAMQFIDGQPLRADGPGRDTRRPEPEPPTRPHKSQPNSTQTFAPEPATRDCIGREEPPGENRPPTLAGRSPDIRRVVSLALQAAEGLTHAHERGVVHRDIKPSNLILDSAGVVWIADFGLAFRADDPTLTTEGALLGTPRYMSPEQARAEKTDCRTDVYSLGVTLYELLTGTVAFPGDTPLDVIQRVLTQTPPRPRELNRRVPRDLETVVLKAMAKRPEDRYANGREFADDLRRFLEGEPVRARRITAVGKAWRWAKRNPAVASLLCAVLMVFAAGAGVSAYFAKHAADREADAKRNEGQAKDNEQKANEAKDKALAAEKANRRLVYDARMILAGDARRQYDHVALANLLREAYAEARPDNPLGWEWNVLFRELYGWSREFDLPAGEVVYVGPTRVIIRDHDNGRWYIHDPVTMARVASCPIPAPLATAKGPLARAGGQPGGFTPPEIRLSGNGRRVAHYQDGVVRVWDIDTGAELARFAVAEPNDHTFGLSDNGRWLSVCHITEPGDPVRLRVWDVDAGRTVRDVKASTLLDMRRALTRVADDGTTAVVWGDGAGQVYQFASEFGDMVSIPYGRQPHEPNRSPPPTQAHVAFHPTGPLDQAIALTDRPAIHIYSGLFADDSGAVRGFPGSPTSLAYSPDGARLAVADATGAITIRTHGSSEPQTLRTPGFSFTKVFFRPDGRRLVGVAGGRAYEWDLARAPPRRPAVEGARIDVESIAFSPDGNCVAAAVDWGDHSHRLLAWEVATGRPLLSAECVGQVTPRSWSPDGRRLVGIVDATPDPSAHVVAAAGGLAGAAAAPRYPSPDPRMRVVVWDVDTGDRLLAFDRELEMSVAAAFSPDGGRIVMEGVEQLGVHDAKTGRLQFVDTDYFLGDAWAFAPSGQHLVVFCEGNKAPKGSGYAVHVWDCAAGRRIDSRRVPVKNAIIPHLRFTPDGRWLVLLPDDREYPATAAYPVAEGGSLGEPVAIKEAHGNREFEGFAASADGRLAAFWGSHSVQVFEVGTWRELAALTLPTDCDVDTVAFVNGRLIASGRRVESRFVAAWDLDTRQPVLSVSLGVTNYLAGSQFAYLDGDVLRVLRVTPDREVLLETLDGTPPPAEIIRARLGTK